MGQVLWDLAGQELADGANSVDLVLDRAGLRWEVEKRQEYVRGNGGELIAVPGQYSPVRMDTGVPMPASVGSQWEPLQNRDLVSFGLSLREFGEGIEPLRAGTFGGGRSVFLEMALGPAFAVTRRGTVERDLSQARLLVYMGHDGSAAIRGQEIYHRFFCRNQLRPVASTLLGFALRHTATAGQRLTEGRRMIAAAIRGRGAFQETAQELAETAMSREEFVRFAAQVLTNGQTREAAEKTYADAGARSRSLLDDKLGELLERFVHGHGNLGRDRFDALNAVSEFVDHQRGRLADWRRRASGLQIDAALRSATFGNGARMKERALELLTRR